MKPPALGRPLATSVCLLALTLTTACRTPSSTPPKDHNVATANSRPNAIFNSAGMHALDV